MKLWKHLVVFLGTLLSSVAFNGANELCANYKVNVSICDAKILKVTHFIALVIN